MTRRCSECLDQVGACGAWRVWALWVDSWPGSSCVSPGTGPVRCTTCILVKHFILVWWIFRPRGFLQTLPHAQTALIVVLSLAWVIACLSVLLGCSSSPPLGHPWGYIPVGFSVACLWVHPHGSCSLGRWPSLPRLLSFQLSTVSPAVTILSWSSSGLFPEVTGLARSASCNIHFSAA